MFKNYWQWSNMYNQPSQPPWSESAYSNQRSWTEWKSQSPQSWLNFKFIKIYLTSVSFPLPWCCLSGCDRLCRGWGQIGGGRANQFLTQISRSICSEVFGRRQAKGTCWFNQKRVFGRHHENIWLDTGGMFLMIGKQKSLQTYVVVAGFKPGWWWDGVKVGKLKEMCLERRVIGDRCDRYGRSGVRGIRRGAAKPTKLGTTWTAGGEPADMKETQTLAARQLLRGFRWQTNSYLASTSTPLSNSQVHTQRQLLSTPYLARSDFYFLFVSFVNTLVLLDMIRTCRQISPELLQNICNVCFISCKKNTRFCITSVSTRYKSAQRCADDHQMNVRGKAEGQWVSRFLAEWTAVGCPGAVFGCPGELWPRVWLTLDWL